MWYTCRAAGVRAAPRRACQTQARVLKAAMSTAIVNACRQDSFRSLGMACYSLTLILLATKLLT
jgi:hypothetical protein